MGTKSSRDLDRSAKAAAGAARGNEAALNDANVASGPDTRAGGNARGWGDKSPKRVERRPGK